MENKKDYRITAETGYFIAKGVSLEMRVKRGEKSWGYFILAYSILLAISLGLIAILPDFNYGLLIKSILMVVISVFLFYLCFSNIWFRNKTVGIFSKYQEKEEVSKS